VGTAGTFRSVSSSDVRESVPPVLLYDGVCGFCHGAVQFILRVDRRGELRFAALDSPFARDVVARHPTLEGVDSVVFVDEPGLPGERVHVRSAAALRVTEYLGWPWQALRVTGLVPSSARDWLYDRFAAIRYSVFGKLDSCPIPPPEVRDRFIDELPASPPAERS
jgi:predicted DCC family thiol-disulfide oxidoreductase YuxK